MNAMSFSSVGYGDLSPSTNWGMMLSPIMMQMGTHTFNLLGAVVNTDDVTKLWEDASARESFIKWSSSCLSRDQRNRRDHDLKERQEREKEKTRGKFQKNVKKAMALKMVSNAAKKTQQ